MSQTGAISVNEWLELYEDPLSVSKRLSASAVLEILQKKPASMNILDLRNDRDPAVLYRSVNIPATTLTGGSHIKEEVVDKLTDQNPSLELIVVHCNSSKKRATKVAGWIQDYLDSDSDDSLSVAILDGGITGWLELADPYKSFLIPFEKI